ncbi:MAG: hypothetical protein GXZ04_00640 [Clostridiales bacterium]|nr:hypothetical protein [Clostridiales bacterium]
MKKNVLILALALLLALPVFGLAAEETAQPETSTPVNQTTPQGAQRGRRWNQTPAAPAATPKSNYVDDNNDGVCDNCGQTQGNNPDAPGFVDADGNGVCDHLGTEQQGQAFGRNQALRGRGSNKRAFGRSQGMNGQGKADNNPGRNFVDADKDGVCDNYPNEEAPVRQGKHQGTQQGGKGRNRR